MHRGTGNYLSQKVQFRTERKSQSGRQKRSTKTAHLDQHSPLVVNQDAEVPFRAGDPLEGVTAVAGLERPAVPQVGMRHAGDHGAAAEDDAIHHAGRTGGG